MKRDRYQHGTLFDEHGKWYVRYSERDINGRIRRPRILVGTAAEYPSRKKARQAADQIMREINDAVAVVRFDHLCDDYIRTGLAHLREYTAATYRSQVGILKAKFGDERLDHLVSPQGRMQIEEWLNSQLISAAYRRRHKAILSLMFRHAMRMGFLTLGANPITLIDMRNLPGKTRPKRRRDVITVEQYHALLADKRLPAMDKVILEIEAITGIRTCEALGLKRDDIDYASSKIHVRRSIKGKYIDEPKSETSRRTVFMPEKLAAILRRWDSESRNIDGWMFVTPVKGRPPYISTIRRHLKDAARRLGFDYKGFGPHNNRHTFRRNLELAGATPEEQMWAMGHSNLPTTHGYGQDGFDRAERLAGPVSKVVSILERKTGSD